MQPVDPFQAGQKKTLIGVGIAIVVLLALLAGVGIGSGFFGLLGGRPQVLDQTGKGGSSLAATTQTAPALADVGETQPVLPAEAKRMPQNIIDWLEHLRRTEEKRKSMSNSQMGELSVQMTYLSVGAGKKALEGLLRGDDNALENNPATEMVDTTAKHRDEWRQLIEFFRSKPAPPECVPIFTAYSESLTETSAMILEISGTLANAMENPEAAIATLNSLKGDSQERVSRPAAETDRLVQEICDQYDTRKWFKIESDYGSGMLGQVGGIPSMGAEGRN